MQQQTPLDALKNCRDAVTAADANRNQRIAASNAVQFIDGFRGEHRARGANRMAQRNSLAIRGMLAPRMRRYCGN